MSTILERIRLDALREPKQYEQAARIAERTGMDLQDALIAARWWPLVPINLKRPIAAKPNTPSSGVSQNALVPRPVSERERLAEACLELIRNWPRYKSVMRYSGGSGHDVSRQARKANGEWTNAGGTSDSANTEQLRGVLERFKALHPLQAQYASDVKLVEEKPSWMNWDNPLHWDGTTLKVRAGTSDFDVLFELASAVSLCKGYKEWLAKQIESGAIEIPREHPKVWSDDSVGRDLQRKERLKEWYQYMEAAGATPAEIEHAKWSRGLNEWFGPGGHAETTLGAVGAVTGALNIRGGGNGRPLMLRGRGSQSLGVTRSGQEKFPSTPPASGTQAPDVRILKPVTDPARPVYRQHHPGKVVDDHVLSREIAKQQGRLPEALAPSNVRPKPFEMNARKGGFERSYLRDRQRLIDGGLSPEKADLVLEETLRWIMNDALPRPMDPRVLDNIPSPGQNIQGEDETCPTSE